MRLSHIKTVSRPAWGLANTYARSLTSALTELLYPDHCPRCHTDALPSGELVCPTCLAELPLAYLNGRDPILEHRLAQQPELEGLPCAAGWLFEAGGPVQELIHSIKYHRHPRLARYLGQLIGHRLRESAFSRPGAALVPIPLHPRKQRQRGINQAEWVARGLADALGLPVLPHLLQRVRHTPSQTGLDRDGRRRNVAGAFELAPGQAAPAAVWVVDDVITTGATLAAAAAALRTAGVPQLGVIALAVVTD